MQAGFFKCIVFFLIAFVFWRDKPTSTIVVTFFIGAIVAFSIEYFSYYRPNIEHHRILKKRLGDRYVSDLNEALREIGLAKMLRQWWFLNQYKKIWKI